MWSRYLLSSREVRTMETLTPAQQTVFSQLLNYGFSQEQCLEAARYDVGLDQAVAILFGDVAPPAPPQLSRTQSQEAVSTLMDYGIARDQAEIAVKRFGNDVQQAVNWVFEQNARGIPIVAEQLPKTPQESAVYTMLMQMGFPEDLVLEAAKGFDDDVDSAMIW